MTDSDYSQHLELLHQWIFNVQKLLNQPVPITISNFDANHVRNGIKMIAQDVKDEYPFYAEQLIQITNKLFLGSVNSCMQLTLNKVVFGELYIIEKHLYAEPFNLQLWTNIHPRICSISKQLYADGHFSASAERAVKEVETRLRELFTELKPTAALPSKIGDIIGALLTETGAYHFVDTSTTSGKDYRKGIHHLFEGIFFAYRNPNAHQNRIYTKRQAIEQIILASQLMYVLDNSEV